MTADPESRLPGSFRDPAGFMFRRDGEFLRQVNGSYESTFRTLMDSGLYASLVDDGLLIPHETVDLNLAPEPGAAAVLRPEQLKFVSYPFEWSFSQLKAAALATLLVQRRRAGPRPFTQGRERAQHPVTRGSSNADRHVVVRALRSGLSVGGLSPVLPALPGSIGGDGLHGCALERPAAAPPGRPAARSGVTAAAVAFEAADRLVNASPPAQPGSGARGHGQPEGAPTWRGA